MRVCLAYTGGLTPRVGGGPASVINNIVKHTCGRVRYVLLTLYREDELEEVSRLYPGGADIEYVKFSGSVFKDFLNYLLKELCDVDVVHFHDFPLGRDLPLAFKMALRGLPLIYSHHISLEEFISNRFLLGYYYSCLNFFGRLFRRVVTNSDFIVRNDLSRFKSLRGKICVVRNGVDVGFIRGIKPLRLDGDPSIVFVGHLVYRKGVDILLRSFRILCSRVDFDPRLHVVGSGLLERWCRKFVSGHDLDGRVRFWGSVDELLKFRILKGADILVLPSRYENLPIVLLEGMAAGKAIVATRVGGVGEVFKHGVNGLLVAPSSMEVAEALRIMCENRDLVEEYGRNNERAALDFDWKKIAEFYVRLYQMV